MANSISQPIWLKYCLKWLTIAWQNVKKAGKLIINPPPVAIEYQRWRNHLIRQRFWLSVGLAVAYLVIASIASFYELFINPEELQKSLALYKVSYLLTAYRQHFIWQKLVFFGLIGFLILLRNSKWGRQHSSLLVILFPWCISFVPSMVLGTFFGIAYRPDIIMFMAQAVIAPIHWHLHLIAQLVPIAYYFIVHSALGLDKIWGSSIYSFSYVVQLLLVCIICEVGVYLYERSKQSELEANRHLQLCIHAITHDLRTPVMGSLMLLESIHQKTACDQPVQIPQPEMLHLIHGYDRLLGLMNTLLDNQALGQSELTLSLQPTSLPQIITTIMQDFQPMFLKKNVVVSNQIINNLPLVNVDTPQIWRVLCNLVSNAINHNPADLHLTLNAVVIENKVNRSAFRPSRPMLKVIVQDNGVGIPIAHRDTIFEPYTRSQQSQYQPGLGLGLYICRQIVQAHGGEIGLEVLHQNTRFWFTLPIQDYSVNE
jgi:nitrogen-specific signal transduction histidine kinase